PADRHSFPTRRSSDLTPLYSGFYRVIFQWFDAGGRGWVPNGMSSDAPDLTVSSYLKMMNIKANHRKAVITEKEALISSANPHNRSEEHTSELQSRENL